MFDLSSLFNFVIEYGSRRNVPYIDINGENVLYLLTVPGMPDLIRSIRDLSGYGLILITLLYVIKSINKLVDGEFE